MLKTRYPFIFLWLFVFIVPLFLFSNVKASGVINLSSHTLNSLSEVNINWTTDDAYSCEVMYSAGTPSPGGYSLLGKIIQTAEPTNDGLYHYSASLSGLDALEENELDYKYQIRCQVGGDWVEGQIFQLENVFADFTVTEVGVKFYDEANQGDYFYTIVKNIGNITVYPDPLILHFSGFEGAISGDSYAAQVLPEGKLNSPYYYYENRSWEVRGPSTNQLDKDKSYNISVEVDSGDVFREENENNNLLTKSIFIDSGSPVLDILTFAGTDFTEKSARIYWETNLKSSTRVEYGKTPELGLSKEDSSQASVKSHSITLSNLEPNTIYYYKVISRDTSSEFGMDSMSGSFITLKTSDLTITNIRAANVTSETFTIKWQTNGNYDCTMIYSTKDGNLDDDFLVSTRDADDYIFGSIFPKSNSSGNYYYATEVKNQGGDTKYFNGDKGYYNLICYDDSRNKVTSSVYSFDIPVENETDNYVDNNYDIGTDNSNTGQFVLQLQRQISALEKQVIELEKKLTQLDNKFAAKYAGTMFLDVENHGRLWYVDPASKNRFYFENGVSALSIGSKLATGITYEDIQKIPVGVPDKLYNLVDSDGDGLSDRLESALGSDPNNSDTDDDGYSDKQELENGYDPTNNQQFNYDQSLIDRLEGKMLLQVSGPNSHGEIWYIHDGQRWYGGTEDSMYEIMKARSLGATPTDIRKIEVGDVAGVE